MNKLHVTVLLLAVLFLPAMGALVGESAGQTATNASQEPIRPAIAPDSRFSIWADPETGCEYVIYRSEQFTPRLSADGSPKGCREIEAMKLEVAQ